MVLLILSTPTQTASVGKRRSVASRTEEIRGLSVEGRISVFKILFALLALIFISISSFWTTTTNALVYHVKVIAESINMSRP